MKPSTIVMSQEIERPAVVEPIVIWGAGGHARTVVDLIECLGGFRIVGFLDDVDPRRVGESFCGQPILGGRSQLLSLWSTGVRTVVVAIGDNDARMEAMEASFAIGLRSPALVHPGGAPGRGMPDCRGRRGRSSKPAGTGRDCQP
jgi:hypothetical protein